MTQPPTPRKVDLFRSDGSIRTFEEIERDVLHCLLRHCGGSVTALSKAIGMGRSTIYRKVDETHRVLARANI